MRPVVVAKDYEVLRVSCPYEPIGYADVTMIKKGDVHQIEDINTPRKCTCCGQYFRLQVNLTLRGEKLES